MQFHHGGTFLRLDNFAKIIEILHETLHQKRGDSDLFCAIFNARMHYPRKQETIADGSHHMSARLFVPKVTGPRELEQG